MQRGMQARECSVKRGDAPLYMLTLDSAQVSGHHEQQELQKLIFKFVRESILCGSCCGPETVILVEGRKKKKNVLLDCKSCGMRTTLDPTLRFVKWMALHPPDLTTGNWGQVRGKLNVLEGTVCLRR